MTKKMLKRILALILTVIMVIGTCPQYVHAEESNTAQNPSGTPVAGPDPSLNSNSEQHTHSYTEGVCTCGDMCTHAAYAEGKCTVCGMDEPIPEPVYGSTTFVYAGTDAFITGANLKFWITSGVAAAGYAENVGITVSASDNSVTLTVDKNMLTADTVWMDIYDSGTWAKLNYAGISFSGETYYVVGGGGSVATAPPAVPDPDPEPHTHNYVDGVCECGEICSYAEYDDGKCIICGMDESIPDPVIPEENLGQATFIYEGTNANVTAANLTVYITWGTVNYNANAEDCGFTVIRNGNTVTLQVDKTTLKDTVWMKIWEDQAWTMWDSISCTFNGETYYLQDGGVFTTEPSGTDPDPHIHTYPDTYTDGKCSGCGEICIHSEYTNGMCTACHMMCTHTYTDGTCTICGIVCSHEKYTDGKCDVCGMDEPTTVPDPEPIVPETPAEGTVSATFVYEGGSAVTANDLVFYITYGTATYNQNAEDVGFTVTRQGKVVTISGDASLVTSTPVYINIWETATGNWIKWEGMAVNFAGEVYHLTDGSHSVDHPEQPDGPDALEGTYQFTVHCYGEGYQIGAWMALVENGIETAWTPNGESKTAAFETSADGWASMVLSWNLTDSYNRLSFQIGEGTPWGSATYNYDFTEKTGEIWIIPGSTTIYTSEESAEEALNSPEPDDTAKYQFTVHCYGEGYQMGAWMALVEDGVEIAWTPSSPAKTAVFENLDDGWTSAVVTWNLADEYNRFGCTIGIDDPWASTKYNMDFTEPSGEMWIVPGDPRIYTSKEAALKGMQTEYEAPYSFTIHCKDTGYQIGAWLELVEGGVVTSWTPEEDGVTAVLENLEDGWTSVTVSWDNEETYNRIGFILGTTDPWTGTQYSYEFDSPTGEDIWVVPGYSGAFSTKKAALANAWNYYYQFKIHCYGEGYQVGAWMAKVENGEETAWTSSGSSVIRSFTNMQDGWTTATVAWNTKSLYNRLGFQIGIESPWDGTKYSFDFTEKIGEIWILPDDPTVYLSEEAALEALNNPASAKYSFNIHCYGENYQVGAWLALVQHNEEVAWTPDGAAVTASFETTADGWSEVWIKWNLPEDYNRLGFTIGVDAPWASENYTYDFKECPVELWIIPGDQNVYMTKEEAEKAMTPGVEMTIPPKTESVETEPTEDDGAWQEEDTSKAPVVIVVGAGTAAGGGFVWWLLQFLKKRKK